jgi:hypothetical protein
MREEVRAFGPYVVAVDHGRPGGDKTIEVIFDREKREFVSIKEIETGVDNQGEAQVVETVMVFKGCSCGPSELLPRIIKVAPHG